MSDLPLRKDFAPRHGEAVTLAAGVRRMVCENPSPFTFKGTNTYLVGEDEVALIDPGPDNPAHLDALKAALGARRVGAIVLTHGHWDHVEGVERFRAAFDAPVLAAREEIPPRAGETGTGPASRGVRADRVIGDGERLEGPGWALEAIATPGHAGDHLCFALDGTDIVFSGDHVMGWSTTVVAPPGGHMGSYLASLRRLIARPETRYLPGHGPEIADGPALARALLTHRLSRESAVLERVIGGDDTVEPIVAALYRGLDPRLVRAASLAVLAHLEHLVERGSVTAEAGLRLDGRFLPA